MRHSTLPNSYFPNVDCDVQVPLPDGIPELSDLLVWAGLANQFWMEQRSEAHMYTQTRPGAVHFLRAKQNLSRTASC